MAWAPDYVTTGELAAYLRIDDTVDDVELALAVSAASRAIDHATNRQFGIVDTAEARTYVARFDHERCRWVVDVDDHQTLPDSVTVNGTTVATFDSEPLNASQEGRPWTCIAFTDSSEATPSTSPHIVDATALWGWTAVPLTVENASLLQSSRFFTRRNAPFGVAGSPDQGSEMRLLARVDPDVAVMLHSFRRPREVG